MYELAEALTKDFNEAKQRRGLTAPMVANQFEKSPTSSWPYQLQSGDVPFTLAMVYGWYLLTGARHFMRYMGRITKHVVFPLADLPQDRSTASVVTEFGQYLEEVGKANADGIIEPDEFQRMEREALEAMGAIHADLERHRLALSTVQHRPIVPPGEDRF